MPYAKTCELSKAVDASTDHLALPRILPVLLLPTRLGATNSTRPGQGKPSEC